MDFFLFIFGFVCFWCLFVCRVTFFVVRNAHGIAYIEIEQTNSVLIGCTFHTLHDSHQIYYKQINAM